MYLGFSTTGPVYLYWIQEGGCASGNAKLCHTVVDHLSSLSKKKKNPPASIIALQYQTKRVSSSSLVSPGIMLSHQGCQILQQVEIKSVDF